MAMTDAIFSVYGTYLDDSTGELVKVSISHTRDKKVALALCADFAKSHKYPVRTWLRNTNGRKESCVKVWNILNRDGNGRLFCKPEPTGANRICDGSCTECVRRDFGTCEIYS